MAVERRKFGAGWGWCGRCVCAGVMGECGHRLWLALGCRLLLAIVTWVHEGLSSFWYWWYQAVYMRFF